MLELLPASTGVGVLHGGLGAPCPTQNFGWVATGHNAFPPPNNWPVCSLVVAL